MTPSARARSILVISAVCALILLEVFSLCGTWHRYAHATSAAPMDCHDGSSVSNAALPTLGVISTTLLSLWIVSKAVEAREKPFDVETSIIITSFGVSSFLGLVLAYSRLALTIAAEDARINLE